VVTIAATRARGLSALNSFGLLGTYLPRQCGIATFTKDLRDALVRETPSSNAVVLAIDDSSDGYRYPDDVRFEIRTQQQQDYRLAADFLNINQIDITFVQHEFGIYGGQDGSYVLDFVRRLRMPVITTLHTVLHEPSPTQASILSNLVRISDRVVVMSHVAQRMLVDIYSVPERKIVHIPHGIPDVPFVDPVFYKDHFGLEGRKVLLTFGLLSPGKGIEHALEALPAVVKKHPDVAYVIVGATHPRLVLKEGNAYRNYLERLVDKLNLRDHVFFHNRFVTLQELCGYIGAADIYLTPYINRAQVTSGTLAYSLGAGKAVVSTPYWYAEEMLADDRGVLIAFNDPSAIATGVNGLLDDDVERNAMRKRAYMFCRPMIWKEVARAYTQLAQEVLAERQTYPRPVFCFRPQLYSSDSVPEIRLTHMRTLTDDVGMLQHASYAVPDRSHGYCTDDNARALYAALLYYDLRGDDSILQLANVYLAFLHHAFNVESGRFRNFMSYERQWLEEIGSEDVHGRALMALGRAVSLAPNDSIRSFATRLFADALEACESLRFPRAWAFSLIGIAAYLQQFGGDNYVRRVGEELAQRLWRRFRDNADEQWPWPEDTLTYANARLPHALIASGRWLGDTGMVAQGLRSLKWLVELQLSGDNTVSLIGNHGWMDRSGRRARFDQQPIEVMGIIEACDEAYSQTSEAYWLSSTRQYLGWFLGSNDTRSVLYDYNTGGCRDGLHADGPNLNQGAESTLAWLISLLTVHRLMREEGVVKARDAADQAAKMPVLEEAPVRLKRASVR